jgi:ceramide glucosyltransferase
VVLNVVLGSLAALSFILTAWQWLVACRFPLHRRLAAADFTPPITLLKPLKGCDQATEQCLRSWFTQDYPSHVQTIFAVASVGDPVCAIVHKLLAEFPGHDAQLVICGPLAGSNAKVSKLSEIEKLAKHEILCISDADVRIAPDFLRNAVAGLADEKVGLVNCFYQLANPSTLAMHWEAIAINADFWSQVLQAQSLKPLDFALGAVMLTRRKELQAIGGFAALKDCLADDYQLGHRIAKTRQGIQICPIVVECLEEPMDWRAVWKHQLRWARTIRVSQPLPYFFSVLSIPTLWPLLWFLVFPVHATLSLCLACVLFRVLTAIDLQRRLTRSWRHAAFGWLVPCKDFFQFAIWLQAFLGNRVEWAGQKMVLRSDGTLSSP